MLTMFCYLFKFLWLLCYFVLIQKLPCFYATNNQRSLECDLTTKNSFLMPPISKYFLIQPNWFPLLELIKKKIAILGTAALPVNGDISLWYCCYNFLNYIKQAFRRNFFNCTYPSHGLNHGGLYRWRGNSFPFLYIRN